MTESIQKFAVGDLVKIKMHATPARWRAREARITRDLSQGDEHVYSADWVEDSDESTSFYDHELELVKPKASKTINIDVKLDFDVETVVSNLRASIAQSLRALADEIEEAQ